MPVARKWSGNLLSNPVAGAEMSERRLQEQPAEQRSPSVDEVRVLLASAGEEDVRLEAFLRLVAATGARRSEVCALRWSEIDASVPSLIIDEATVVDEGIVAIKGRRAGRASAASQSTSGRWAYCRLSGSNVRQIAAGCNVTLAPVPICSIEVNLPVCATKSWRL